MRPQRALDPSTPPGDHELVVSAQAVDAAFVAASLEGIHDLAPDHVSVWTSECRHGRSDAHGSLKALGLPANCGAR